MNIKELWDLYVSKNPHFERDEKITLRREMLRKMFDQTYYAGFEHGKSVAQELLKRAKIL